MRRLRTTFEPHGLRAADAILALAAAGVFFWGAASRSGFAVLVAVFVFGGVVVRECRRWWSGTRED